MSPKPKRATAEWRRAKVKETEESGDEEWSPTQEKQWEQARELGIKEFVEGLSKKEKKALLAGMDPGSSPPRAGAQGLTSQQRSILRRATHDPTIVRQILWMLQEDEKQGRKVAEEKARLKALVAQKVRVDEEVRALQDAREGAQALDPRKEKQEKKAKRRKDGGSPNDR